jgi:hypothetical protein
MDALPAFDLAERRGPRCRRWAEEAETGAPPVELVLSLEEPDALADGSELRVLSSTGDTIHHEEGSADHRWVPFVPAYRSHGQAGLPQRSHQPDLLQALGAEDPALLDAQDVLAAPFREPDLDAEHRTRVTDGDPLGALESDLFVGAELRREPTSQGRRQCGGRAHQRLLPGAPGKAWSTVPVSPGSCWTSRAGSARRRERRPQRLPMSQFITPSA